MSFLIDFKCERCGVNHKILIKDNILRVSCLDKLISTKLVFDKYGFFKCSQCEYISEMKFLNFI
jgi:hypothetical protein